MTSKFKVRGLIWGATAVILASTTVPMEVLAQNEANIKAGLTAWRNSGCSDCHGAFANGEKERDESPTGADLRRTRLNADELRLAIRCGRPGTGMPSFEEATTGCASGTTYPAPRNLSPDEINNIVTYLQARIVGRGKITRQECLYYYDGKEDWCEDYK